MKKVLLEVNCDTFEIYTLDGEKYRVVPDDIIICCTWTPTMELEIDNNKKTCTATSIGVTVRIE